MQAVLLPEHGDSDVLTLGEAPTPEPGPGEVRVAIRAAALNHLDIWVRRGWEGIRIEYPHIPGADGAGVIDAVGDGVTSVRPGDRVVINPLLYPDPMDPQVLAGRDNLARRAAILGEDMHGTFAEYVVVPERNVLLLPDHVPFSHAAAAALVSLTAWHSLLTKGGLRAGESILIVGAGGGVNTAAIQIAQLAGAEVYVVGSTAEKCHKAHELGAHHTIDRSETDWGRAIYQMTEKRGVDVVVDNVGQATWPTSLRALTRGGRMLVVGNTSGYAVTLDSRYIFAKHLSIIGSTMGTQDDFRTMMSLLFDGRLQPVIDRTLRFDEAKQAHDALEAGEVFGKIVMLPG
ncbi:MAG: zinc-binding dehydrogenase [Anaerolineae bacterium]